MSDETRSLEGLGRGKRVLNSRPVCGANSAENWCHIGPGEMHFPNDMRYTGQKGIRLTAPAFLEGRPSGALEEGDCSNYGISGAAYAVAGKNWEAYNRIALRVFPHCEGVRSICITLSIKNEGKIKIPDLYNREGHHLINLKNNEWNDCTLEISDLPRDKIAELKFTFYISGRETGVGSCLRFDITDMELQAIEQPEIVHGWIPQKGQILYSGSGYSVTMPKTAFAAGLDAREFKLVNSGGETAFSGEIRQIENELGQFQLMDFTAFDAEGTYKIMAGASCTEFFPIGGDIWEPSVWKVINFLFCERCGYPVPNRHLSCHRDVRAVHEGKSFIFNGGWHDAGDVSQQMIQSAEVTYGIFELAGKLSAKNDPLYSRLLEEGEWGLDYVLKSRFGDGYRATSVGMSMWTDGFMGTSDDISARVHNHAFENFTCAAIEAFCCSQLQKDKILAARVLECAEQDFEFALKQYEKVGFDELPVSFWEHTYMTSESLYMATASWSASMLFKMTGKTCYAQKAVEFTDYVLSCQNREPIGKDRKLNGFFYRNPSKNVIQHFNHQARDQVYMQALTLICETQPEHEKSGQWREAIELYAGYLKNLMSFMKPYGMLPSGVYQIDEAQDTESFSKQHLMIGEEAKNDYIRQLENGVDLGEGYFLKRFPVWFSFRGNNAVLLSMGKCASICGRFLNDRELLSIAEEQLQWIVGKNPFAQSMMYGEGIRYAQQYAALPGEMAGELPVGIQTRGNEDLPYWPQMNNATYKEVWTTPAGRWLSILADLYASSVDKLAAALEHHHHHH
nr:putative glycosyl hydrolase [synthetic construct]